MRTLLLILQIFIGICLLLLPIAVFRRTWMFRVGITKKDHRTTRRLMMEWMLAGLFAAVLLCGLPVLQTIRHTRTRELADSCAALRHENRSLRNKILHSQTENTKLMRGGTHYLYDGSTITARHYKGRETKLFERMVELRDRGDWRELAAVAERQIARTPRWLTPYLFLGQAHLEMGHTNKALANLQHVSKAAPLDPSYRLVHELLSRIQIPTDSAPDSQK